MVCVTTVSRAWQTGSEISGHPKTRASVLILPAGNDSLARFRGNAEDSQTDKEERRNLKDMLLCIGESISPVIENCSFIHSSIVFEAVC